MSASNPVHKHVSRIGGLGVLGLLVVAAEAGTRVGMIDPIFFPPPTQVLSTLIVEVSSFAIPSATAITLWSCFAGYLLAAGVGIPVGMWMGRSRVAYMLMEPLVEVLRPIPSAALIPVAIVFFGIETEMRVAVVVFGALWPILLNSVSGARSVDPLLLETGRAFSFGRVDLYRKILIPAALPAITTGLRISLAIALILAVTVEMVAGGDGLGFYILDHERSFKYPQMYAGILFLGLVGFSLNLLFSAIERRYLFWAGVQ
jgi:ABC-type nitrate/sulfonate/bicarbonate transport system permease component